MAFPRVRTLIVSPGNWYSHWEEDGTIELTVGSLYEAEHYPLDYLIDGSIGPMTRWATTSAGVKITLDEPRDLNILGIFNHNLDPTVLIQPYLNGVKLSRTFRAAYPNCWIDLRGFDSLTSDAFPNVTTIELRMYGNSRPIAISEIVAAEGYLFDGTIDLPLNETILFPTSRHYTEYGRLLEASYGVQTRQMTMSMQLRPEQYDDLLNVFGGAGNDRRCIVVPTTRRNDIWMVRWPMQRSAQYLKSYQQVTVPLELIEEAPGALV